MDASAVKQWLKDHQQQLEPKPMPTKAPQGMRKFTVARINDFSGVSGTGVIAQGVEFATGEIVVQWLTPFPDGDIQQKRNWDQFLNVHVHSHPTNITVITFEDGECRVYPEPKESDSREAGS